MSTAYRYAILGAAGLFVGLSATLSTVSADSQSAPTPSVPVATAGVSGLPTLSPTAGSRPLTVTKGSVPARGLEYSGEVLEPDPTMYDREAVDRWWQDYQSRHHGGQ